MFSCEICKISKRTFFTEHLFYKFEFNFFFLSKVRYFDLHQLINGWRSYTYTLHAFVGKPTSSISDNLQTFSYIMG